MSLAAEQFVESLDGRVNDILDACTKCGACASVCPTPKIAGLTESPKVLGKGIVKILQGETITGDSKVWLNYVVGAVFVNLFARKGSTRGLCWLWLEELLTVEKIWKVGGLKGKKHFKK